MEEVELLLPVAVGDYTDFYCSKVHAGNVGSMFRGPENALTANWEHMPIGYHGRASSMVVSGALVRRPWGQIKLEERPIFAPSRALDFELEMAAVLGASTCLGEPIPIGAADRHIFGYALLNDLSARDIQKWEYQPLGPFNGKNFATVMAPWIVQHEALEPFLTDAPEQSPTPLPYLRHPGQTRHAVPDVTLAVALWPPGAPAACPVATARLADVYWTFEQMLAHHTAGGCSVRAGDVIATGTVSSEGPRAQGCLLELTRNGAVPIELERGLTRAWLQDGDGVRMRAWAGAGSQRVGFGPCDVTIMPARPAEDG